MKVFIAVESHMFHEGTREDFDSVWKTQEGAIQHMKQFIDELAETYDKGEWDVEVVVKLFDETCPFHPFKEAHVLLYVDKEVTYFARIFEIELQR